MREEPAIALTVLAMLPILIVPSQGYAQRTDVQLPHPGILPDNQFYGLKRTVEMIWMSLTFGDDAKALRSLELAQTRLAEAHAMANGQKPEFVDVLLKQYRTELENADRLASSLPDDKKAVVSGRIAIATSWHLTVLDDLGEKVPENGRAAVMAAREDSMKGNMKALRDLASKDPEKAAEIAMSIANGRANVATKAASDGHDKEALKAIDDLNAYKNLVDEIKATKQPKEHDAGEKQNGNSKKTP